MPILIAQTIARSIFQSLFDGQNIVAKAIDGQGNDDLETPIVITQTIVGCMFQPLFDGQGNDDLETSIVITQTIAGCIFLPLFDGQGIVVKAIDGQGNDGQGNDVLETPILITQTISSCISLQMDKIQTRKKE